MVAAVLALRVVFDPILGKRVPFLFFPLAILLAARFGGWLPGLLATLLSSFAGLFFLISPPLNSHFETREDAEYLILFFISSVFISLLGGHLHATLISKTRSEQAAKQGEAEVRALLDSAAQAIIAVDVAGTIVMANRMTETIFGYRPEELRGRPLDVLIPEDVRSRHREYHHDFFFHPRRRMMGARLPLRALHKNGSILPVEIGLSYIRTAGGMFAIAFVTDITERTRIDEERQKFVSLADRSPTFIGMCDLHFRPSYINSAGMRLVGVDSLEEARRTKIQDYLFPEDRAFMTNEFFPRVLRDGHSRIEVRLRQLKTGKPIWMLHDVFSICDSSSVVIGWATVSIDIGEQKRAERALSVSRQELRALAGRLINAEEEARKQISRELHDDLGQKLAILAFDCGSLLLDNALGAEQIRQEVRNIETRVVQISQDVRQIAHQLHPSILEDLGITAALRELCHEFSAREGIEAIFCEDQVEKKLPVSIASCLYRVTQEALHNVSKHANARKVCVRLNRVPDGVHLNIHDSGIGFDTNSESFRSGLGIVSMKERVRLVQGEFSINSEPGHGTEVRVFVPFAQEKL